MMAFILIPLVSAWAGSRCVGWHGDRITTDHHICVKEGNPYFCGQLECTAAKIPWGKKCVNGQDLLDYCSDDTWEDGAITYDSTAGGYAEGGYALDLTEDSILSNMCVLYTEKSTLSEGETTYTYKVITGVERCSSSCGAQCASGECCKDCEFKSQGKNCGTKDCGGEYLTSGKNCLYRTYTCGKTCTGNSADCPDCSCNNKVYIEETKASCSECQDLVCSSSSQKCVNYIDGVSCSAGKCLNGGCVVSMTASVWGASPVWQNTYALASVKCNEKIPGECGPSTAYKLKVYSEKPIACSNDYNEYNLESPTNISGHMWACGVAKSSEGKPFFSEPVEFKINKTITALEAKETEEALTYCDAISGDITRNLCYMTYASELLEQAVCDYISNIAQKDVCKQKVSLLGE